MRFLDFPGALRTLRKRPKRAEKADFGRFPGRAARHPLSPHLLHPYLRQSNLGLLGKKVSTSAKQGLGGAKESWETTTPLPKQNFRLHDCREILKSQKHLKGPKSSPGRIQFRRVLAPGILQSESCANFSSWRCESQCEFLSEFRCEFLGSAVAFLGRFK